MKRITIVLIFSVLFFNGCKYFRGDHCNNTKPIVGTYENVYDKEAKNILIIRDDGTFEQIFNKGNAIKKNTGTWKFFKKTCHIRLENLSLLHSLSKSNEQFFKKTGIHRLNNIVFVEGMSYEFNFYRIDD